MPPNLLSRSEIRAERSGLLIYAAKSDWIGKPVAVGERLMEIGDPTKAEIKIELPVSDAIALQPGGIGIAVSRWRSVARDRSGDRTHQLPARADRRPAVRIPDLRQVQGWPAAPHRIAWRRAGERRHRSAVVLSFPAPDRRRSPEGWLVTAARMSLAVRSRRRCHLLRRDLKIELAPVRGGGLPGDRRHRSGPWDLFPAVVAAEWHPFALAGLPHRRRTLPQTRRDVRHRSRQEKYRECRRVRVLQSVDRIGSRRDVDALRHPSCRRAARLVQDVDPRLSVLPHSAAASRAAVAPPAAGACHSSLRARSG